MRRVLPVLLVLLLAGCTLPGREGDGGPPPTPTPAIVTFPVDLAAHRNATLLLDVGTGAVETVAPGVGQAWLSPSGRYVVHRDAAADAWVILDRVTQERAPVALERLERASLRDDATLLLVEPHGIARAVDARTGEERTNATLPTHPDAARDARWTHATDDLRVLASETPSNLCCPPCSHDVLIQTVDGPRHETTGCGLALSPGGRAAWSSSHAIHVRDPDGTLRPLSPQGTSSADAGAPHLDHRSPAFLGETGIAYVRLTGTTSGQTTDSGPLVNATRVDVIVHDLPAPQGRTVATLSLSAGPGSVRLLGGTAEGRLLLLSVL